MVRGGGLRPYDHAELTSSRRVFWETSIFFGRHVEISWKWFSGVDVGGGEVGLRVV